ncbi:hypothetical protein SDC9_211380 [bioreactor metagenome]|uniref:Uncharacterized protein n=1 Tax=bioreactor metagenome TaxID=1076179 RepID=A0A645JJK6_9ZZZZ
MIGVFPALAVADFKIENAVQNLHDILLQFIKSADVKAADHRFGQRIFDHIGHADFFLHLAPVVAGQNITLFGQSNQRFMISDGKRFTGNENLFHIKFLRRLYFLF